MRRGRVLVTGGNGLIGRHLAAGLGALGFEMHAVSRRGGPGPNDHAVDIFDAAGVDSLLRRLRPSHLLHLAWTTEHGKFWHDSANEDWLRASLRLVDAFAAHGGRHLVGAGTCAEYDWTQGDGDLSAEDAPIRPATPYGEAKARLAEALLTRSDLTAAWGRIFFVFGPGEDSRRLIPSVAQAVLRGMPADIGPGDQIRDFIDSRDAARLFTTLLAGGLAGPFNIATGQGHRIRDVAARMADLAGRPELLRIGALPARPDDPPRLVGEASRLWALTETTPTPLDDSLRWVLERHATGMTS